MAVIGRISTWSALVGVWLLASVATAAPLQPSVKMADVDLAATGAFVVTADGEMSALPLESDQVARLIGHESPRRGGNWSARDVAVADRVFLRLAFKTPQALGTLYVERDQGSQRLSLLKAGAATDAAPTDASAWQVVTVPAHQDSGCVTLPVGTTTQAILVELTRSRSSRLTLVMPFAERYADLRGGAVLQARLDDLAWPLENLQTGRKWLNTDFPTGKDKLVRPPISEFDPGWFIYSWDTPQTVAGVLMQSNATNVEIWALREDVAGNPSLAPPAAWRRVKAQAREGRISFAPVETRALKLNVVGVDTDHHMSKKGQILEVYDIRILMPLGTAEPPVFHGVRMTPPYEFEYELDRAGELALAVNAPDGTRVANLVANVEREPGTHTMTWNLRDTFGNFVEPGTYRWTGVIGPRPDVRYVTTVYPNIPVNSPQNSAWLNGHHGTGGWLADHSGNSAIAAGEHGMWMAGGTAESGVSTIETDFDGNKRWGRHNLAPWRGPQFFAPHGDGVYAAVKFEHHDQIWYIDGDRETHEYLTIQSLQTRHHGLRGMAVRGDEMFLAFISPDRAWLGNAFAARDVDVKKALPALLDEARGGKPEDRPNPQNDLLRLLRLAGTPAGHPHADGLSYISSGMGKERKQHVLIPFLREVPIGTLVYKAEKQTDYSIRFSVAKADAPYPPDIANEAHWQLFDAEAPTGWQAVAAPANTTTRALRITFTRGGEDELAALLDEPAGDADPLGATSDVGAMMGGDAWEGRLEGLRILRRRYVDTTAGSTIRVNSGTVAPDGSWDAERTEPLSDANPGIYVMQWDTEQTMRGIVIQEVDGEETLVDVYTGPAGEIDIAGDEHWQQVGRYIQARRYYYQPDVERSPLARYLDGTVDFGESLQTRAVRLRVVKQWSDSGHRPYGVREDRGGTKLQPARCRVYGVLPLRHVGDEPPVDPLMTQRLEVRDLKTKKVTREFHVRLTGRIHIAADGTLYGLSDDAIVRVDHQTGEVTPVITDLEKPWQFAIAPNGDFAVFDKATLAVYRYDATGKRVATIGTSGGWKPGPWDPARFNADVRDMAIDKHGQIWVLEGAHDPKRIIQFAADGSFQREFLGNTNYGGAGSLDRYDRTRVRMRRMQFEVDWETGKSKLSDMLFLDDVAQRNSFSATDFDAIMYNGRKYLVTGPSHPSFSASVIHVYLDEGHTARLVAAMGNGKEFDPLSLPSLREKLAGKVPADYDFEFTDRNGDGLVQPEEVTLFDMSHVQHGQHNRWYGADRIDMGICTRYGFRHEVAEVLENGAPVYRRVPMTVLNESAEKVGLSPIIYARKLSSGNWYVKGNGHNAVFTAEGTLQWAYPFDHEGVTSLWIAPWKPGWVTHQFVMIGNETPANSELGEIFVMNSNAGQWSVWTADGLLAAQIFLHKGHPDARTLSFPEHERGMLWSDVTMNQEHFSGSFVMTEADGKTYVVAGHNHVSIAEVSGWDRFKRINGEITVTADDIKRQIEWEAQAAAREVYVRAPIITAQRGNFDSIRDAEDSAVIEDEESHRHISLALRYDDQNLYLRYNVPRHGPLQNSGRDDTMLYKTGAAIDLHIGADPEAPSDREAPVAGDQRLLITMVDGQPRAVLYVAKDPAASDDQAWEVFTPAGGKVTFDRVQVLDNVKVYHELLTENHTGNTYGYSVIVVVPLRVLGLTPKPGTQLRLDWGVLVTDQGNDVKQRKYWANRLNTGTADAAMEARLRPRLWGHLRFPAEATGPDRAESLLNPTDTETDGMLEDLLDEL